ncbi:MAG TPA: O-methyltransferase [Gemmatimonadaceae bacterium]|jgi:predicted O-methyltransferase YrrM|nr:O-methyltransferase [Gemmatimonadaceae bacterium]
MSDQVNEYITGLFAQEDDLLRELRDEAARVGLPAISVPPETARFLQVLVQASNASRVLEVGTLGGYSAIWMARAMGEGGSILSLEIDPEHASFARRYIERAGLSHAIEVRVGPALQLLPTLDGEKFDVVFLDADKEPLPTYLDWALRLLRPGGLVIADNTLRGGRVADPAENDDQLRAIREFNRKLASSSRLTGLVVPIGDGVAVGVLKS